MMLGLLTEDVDRSEVANDDSRTVARGRHSFARPMPRAHPPVTTASLRFSETGRLPWVLPGEQGLELLQRLELVLARVVKRDLADRAHQWPTTHLHR
jgi:hypothetical protein